MVDPRTATKSDLKGLGSVFWVRPGASGEELWAQSLLTETATAVMRVPHKPHVYFTVDYGSLGESVGEHGPEVNNTLRYQTVLSSYIT